MSTLPRWRHPTSNRRIRETAGGPRVRIDCHTLQATFSGISLCTCFVFDETGDVGQWIGDPNGTYDLEVIPTDPLSLVSCPCCRWGFIDVEENFTWQDFDPPDCLEAPEEERPGRVEVIAFRGRIIGGALVDSSTIWTVQMFLRCLKAPFGGAYPINAFADLIFMAEIDTSLAIPPGFPSNNLASNIGTIDDCGDPVDFLLCEDGAPGEGLWAGYGGIVDITS